MIFTCIHGYFIFREEAAGEVAYFNSAYDQDLDAVDDYYTFTPLIEIPKYTILGNPLLNLVATKTYSGKPWEIMEQNQVIYDFTTGLLALASVPKVTAQYSQSFSYFVSTGLILPGSVNKDFEVITGYQGQYDQDLKQFKYTEIVYA